MLLTELEIHNNQNAAGSEVKQRGRKKGGDPLDFRLANAASHSVQSTSLTDQQPEQFVISEAKCSFALANSPPGDSVESSGRPGVPLAYEPNSADNLMLFDGENSIPTVYEVREESETNPIIAVYSNGKFCISILHPPGEDPNGYELASERSTPVHTVKRKKLLEQQIDMDDVDKTMD
ncbi:hypothetical protein AgCh_015576 [Apium graveolens]